LKFNGFLVDSTVSLDCELYLKKKQDDCHYNFQKTVSNQLSFFCYPVYIKFYPGEMTSLLNEKSLVDGGHLSNIEI